MQSILKIIAWAVWGAVFGGFFGFLVLRSYSSYGLETDMQTMMRVVFLRGGIMGGTIGLLLGLAASATKKKKTAEPTPPHNSATLAGPEQSAHSDPESL